MVTRLRHILLLTIIQASGVLAQQLAWRPASGSEGLLGSAIDVFKSFPDTVFAIAGNRLLRSVNRGETWDSISFAGAAGYSMLRVDPRFSNIIHEEVPGLNGNDLKRSSDGGNTWTPIFYGLLHNLRILEYDPTEDGTLYAGLGSARIYRSSDRGITWDTLTWPGTGAIVLQSLAIAKTDNRILYAGYLGGGGRIYKSTDRGESWNLLPFAIGFNTLVRLAVSPLDDNIVYAGVYSGPPTYPPGGMWKSTDGGLNWNEINSGLVTSEREVHTLELNPKNPDELFVGFFVTAASPGTCNLFHTANGGMSWEPYCNGLPYTTINSIALDTLNGRVYVGLNGMEYGIYFTDFVSSIPLIEESDSQGRASLHSYSNRSGSSVWFDIGIAEQGNATLTMYDCLGRQVGEVMNEVLSVGTYSRSFNTSSLASGAYFARLRSGRSVLISKVLLLK